MRRCLSHLSLNARSNKHTHLSSNRLSLAPNASIQVDVKMEALSHVSSWTHGFDTIIPWTLNCNLRLATFSCSSSGGKAAIQSFAQILRSDCKTCRLIHGSCPLHNVGVVGARGNNDGWALFEPKDRLFWASSGTGRELFWVSNSNLARKDEVSRRSNTTDC